MERVLILEKNQLIKVFDILNVIHKNKTKGQFIVLSDGNRFFMKYYFMKNEKCINMVSNEVEKLLKLSEFEFVPKIVGYDFNNLCYLIEEEINGNNLDKHKFNNNDEKVDFIFKLLNIMKIIHENNIIHGDLKPANIIIDEFGSVKIVDFEISRYIDQDDAVIKDYGSVLYASPEQIRKEKLSFKSDIYQIGMIMLKLFYDITGFEKLSYNEIVKKKLVCNFTSSQLTEMKKENYLLYIINKSICTDEKLRYNNIDELLKDLSMVWGVEL